MSTYLEVYMCVPYNLSLSDGYCLLSIRRLAFRMTEAHSVLREVRAEYLFAMYFNFSSHRANNINIKAMQMF